MKKIIFTMVATSLVAFTASADTAFTSGWKVGFGAGFKNHSVKQGTEATALPAVNLVAESALKTKSEKTANFQIHGGYDFIMGKYLIGVEGQYRYSPGKVILKKSLTGDVLISPGPDHELTQNHLHDWAIALNAGGLVAKNVALYAIGSVRLGRFVHTSRNTKPGLNLNANGNGYTHEQKTQYRWGVGFGAGVRWKAYENVSVGFEATYDMYQKMTIGDHYGGPVDITSKASNVRIFNAMLTTSWHF